ncbi:MAG: response regulator [Oscillospiraceae bacterium]|jgi:two-component system response regulator (stage 0 sporulation protein A)|nr:response regulator [Oscillospiraceae bacterium]
MHSIILIDDDQDWCNIISLRLQDHPEFSVVAQAGTGKEAIVLIDYYRPSVILLDIVMPDYDGMRIIRYIGRMEDYNPSIYIITGYATDSIVKMLGDMDIVRYDLKPIDVDLVIGHLKAMVGQAGTEKSAADSTRPRERADQLIETALLQIGMPANLLGFLYVKTALKNYLGNREVFNDVTTNLYPDIAEQFQVKTSVVERNIRTAISACERNGTKLFQEIFLVNPAQKVTNKIFLILLAKYFNTICSPEDLFIE